MRIAIITDAWHPQVNGVVTTYTQSIRLLRQTGHEVLAITPQLFRTIPCPSYPDIPLSLFPRKKMRRLLDDFQPEAIHIATEGPLGWAARACCLKQGFGFTTAYHTRFPEYIRMRIPVPLALLYAGVRRFHDPAIRTMVATADLETELSQKGFGHMCLWSRGVDVELFRPGNKEFLAARRPIFMYVGRVAVEKNIEAFLRLELPGTKYVIGDGPARPELRRRFPEAYFSGMKTGKELANHLAAADVLVFPSKTDTFGIVLLEAMACGVPVAAYPVTGPQQTVQNGVNGFLDDDLGLAALAALTIDSGACRNFAVGYSWQKCTEQFVQNLHRLDAPAVAAVPAALAVHGK